MRVEPYGIGSVVHVVKRGARGMDIVNDEADRWRFVRLLYLLNDTHQPRNNARVRKSDLHTRIQDDIEGDASQTCTSASASFFERPDHWPERDPLVAILGWTLMPNHLHLLIQEIRAGGISKFTQRLFGSMSSAHNQKYNEKGSIFQGSFRGKTVDTDEYMRYVFPYVVVKNVLELYPEGLESAVNNFDKAWKWAATDPFSSCRTAAHGDRSPIIDHDHLVDLGLLGKNFKQDARDMLSGHMHTREDFSALMLEDW